MAEVPQHEQIESDNAPVIEPALSEAPSVEWQRYSQDSAGAVIRDPGVGQIVGTITDHGPDSPRSLYVDMFSAEQPGHGQGKKLIELLKEEGLKYGVASMSGHFTSSEALGAFASVVGGEGIAFRERLNGKSVAITVGDAMEHPESYIATADIAGTSAAKQFQTSSTKDRHRKTVTF